MKTIGIYTPNIPGLEPWDPDSIRTGIGGSEESVIYASEALVRLGYQVTVINNLPPTPRYFYTNPRYRKESDEIFDIAILARSPQLTKIAHARKIFFWPQDTWERPLDEKEIETIDDIFWISSWQREQWISINPFFAKYTSIFGSGLEPKPFGPMKQRKKPHSCIYASNYGRGLEVLLDIWPEVKKKFPKASLDIYYGWKHWGTLSKFQESYLQSKLQQLAPLDVKEHGLVGHDKLAKALGEASFWTYPCIKDETFCITAIKAQFAGAIPVIIEGSALKETVQHGFKCSQREDYLSTLLRALEIGKEISINQRKKMGEFVQKKFTWEKIAELWKEQF